MAQMAIMHNYNYLRKTSILSVSGELKLGIEIAKYVSGSEYDLPFYCLDAELAIGNQIKSIRVGKKISMHDFANKIGVSVSLLDNLEKGEEFIHADILVKIAYFLKINPTEFYPLLDDSFCMANLRRKNALMLHMSNYEYLEIIRTKLRNLAQNSNNTPSKAICTIANKAYN